MTLTDRLVFDINGSVVTSGGQIPNFQRGSTANAEFLINGSLKTVETALGQPRFSSKGYLFLERGSTNLLPNANDFTGSEWVKGSSVNVIGIPVQSLDGQFKATRISVSSTLGNTDAQTMYQELILESGTALSCTFFLQLASGQFSPNDKIALTGDVAATSETYLAAALNQSQGNWVAVTVEATTDGDAVTQVTDDDDEATIAVSIYVESAVSFNIAAVQLEPGKRTSFITPSPIPNFPASRADDILQYPESPIEGLDSFVFYCHLDEWKEDGRIFESGNFSVGIVGGQVQATAGAVTATDPDALPASPQIAVRVSRGLERLNIYVDGVLKVSENLSGYTGNQAFIAVAGDGLRVIQALYIFNSDIGDGSAVVGGAIAGELAELFEQDTLLNDLSEGYGQIVFSPYLLPAGDRIQVRLPQIPFASQGITQVNPGSGDTAQVVTVRVEETEASAQRDTVTINQSKYDNVSSGTPNANTIASSLASGINTAALEPVTAEYSSGNSFTITANVAGDSFAFAVSKRLSVELTTANVVESVSVVVPNAVDFELGKASVFDGTAWICDVSVEAINLGTNTLTLRIEENSQFGRIQVGMNLFQPSWESIIPRTSYVVHTLEDHSDIELIDKDDVSFSLENKGESDLTVTPYIKVTM